MEAVIALIVLLFGLSATERIAEEENETQEPPVQMEMVVEEETMEKV